VGVVFVVVIFVWLLKFNNIVRDEFGKVGASSGVVCVSLRLVHYIIDCLICGCLTFLSLILVCQHCV